MIKSTLRTLKNALIGIGFVLSLMCISALHALRISNEHIRDIIAPPPLYGVRFVLHPNHYIDGATELGFKPAWVVTYAPRTRNYGTAICVSLFGSILATGTPAIVYRQQQLAKSDLEKFQRIFAQVDAAIRVGMPFSNVTTMLPLPPAMLTNRDGTIDATYVFEPRALEHISVDWLTNGITLHLSNGIVIGKEYIYTSSH